jgi:hypothetical protein
MIINNNIISFSDNDAESVFAYNIRKAIEIGGIAVVLLAILFNDDTVDNIYGISEKNGEILWRVQSLGDKFKQFPYENMEKAGDEIIAIDFYGRRSFINVANGEIIRKDIVR